MFKGEFEEEEDIKGQFREDIRLIVHSCRKNKNELTDQLLSLHDFAMGNGLSEKAWMELIIEIDPNICSFISFAKKPKMVA